MWPFKVANFGLKLIDLISGNFSSTFFMSSGFNNCVLIDEKRTDNETEPKAKKYLNPFI